MQDVNGLTNSGVKAVSKDKMRHELKYNVNYSDLAVLRSRLKLLMQRDPHAGPTGIYTVTSLYFDDCFNSAFHDKENGLEERHKYRIRCYNNSPDFIVLERKDKLGAMTRKLSQRISNEDYLRIISGDTSFLKDGAPLLNEFYRKTTYSLLKPAVIVEYDREPFIYHAGNVRITFDTALRFASPCSLIYDPNKPAVPVNEKAVNILEIKFDEFLPDFIHDAIQLNTRQKQSNSKYVMCRLGNIDCHL